MEEEIGDFGAQGMLITWAGSRAASLMVRVDSVIIMSKVPALVDVHSPFHRQKDALIRGC